MKITKKLFAFIFAVIMFVSVVSVITVSAADAPPVAKSLIKERLEKLRDDLKLVEGSNKMVDEWYWNAHIRSTDTLKQGIDNYIKYNDISYIKAHLTNDRCAGYSKDKTHSYTEKVAGGKYGYGCDSNWISSNEQKQCYGFATYIEYYLFGAMYPDNTEYFTKFTLKSAKDLQIGDHVRINGHSFIYYGLNSADEIICIQANGWSKNPCGLNFGRVYGTSDYLDTTSVVGATIYRYKNVTDCAHDKVTFVSDSSVPCVNCGYNFAYPVVSGSGAYMDVVAVNSTDTAPAHVTPYGAATIKDNERYKKGDTVYVVGSATNGFKHLWYKLSNGNWISGEYLGAHKHTKVNGYCTRCTDKLNIVELNNFTVAAKASGSFPVHFAPYGASPKFYRSGSVKVSGKVINGYNNVWYRLSDGGWVFVNYLNPAKQSGLVKISGDTLAVNSKAASSGTSGSKMIAELSNNSAITIYPGENVGKWYSIRYKNTIGYAHSNWITVTDTTRAVEAYPGNEEPGLSASDLADLIVPSPSAPAPSGSAASVLYPTDATYLNKISVSETNAVVVANVRKNSGSRVTVCGLLLYDANGNLIKDHRENISNVGASNTNFHTWYDINAELGITLSAGTTYKYRFYTVVDGTTYYGETYSFTTKPSSNTPKAYVLYPTDATYLNKISVSETNAVVVANVRKNSGTKVTVCGLLLYDANGNLIKDHKENISNVSAANTNFHTWYDINGELGITLTAGTTYKYRFYTVVDGATYYGETYSFTTTPGKEPVKEEPETEPKEEPEQEQEQEEAKDVYYNLIFDSNGGTCNVSYKSIKFDTLIGEMPVPTRKGYTFTGWYGAAEGGNLIHENMRYNAPFDVTVYAHWEKETYTVNMWIGDSEFEVNGKKAAIDAEGTAPIIRGGRTLVPIRAIVEAMGGTVEWDGSKNSVTMTLGEHTVRVIVYMPYAEVDGKYKALDVAPEIIGGRTMVPVRFVSENLGADVKWDPDENRVTITY